MSNDSDSFIKEVDEGVRQDRFIAMARRIAPWAGVVLLTVLVGVFVSETWTNHQRDVSEQAAVNFAAAQEQAANGDVTAASTRFASMSTQGPDVYRVM